jgi:hypothetical protein
MFKVQVLGSSPFAKPNPRPPTEKFTLLDKELDKANRGVLITRLKTHRFGRQATIFARTGEEEIREWRRYG